MTQTIPMTISTTTIAQPPREATLEELQLLKRQWLDEAQQNGHLLACKTIAKTLGEPFELPTRREVECHRWTSGPLQIELLESVGNWQPGRQDYTRKWTIHVKYHDRHLCHYHETTGPSNADNFFVPGSWTDELMAPLRQAQEQQAEIKNAVIEAERQKLLSQLLGI